MSSSEDNTFTVMSSTEDNTITSYVIYNNPTEDTI